MSDKTPINLDSDDEVGLNLSGDDELFESTDSDFLKERVKKVKRSVQVENGENEIKKSKSDENKTDLKGNDDNKRLLGEIDDIKAKLDKIDDDKVKRVKIDDKKTNLDKIDDKKTNLDKIDDKKTNLDKINDKMTNLDKNDDKKTNLDKIDDKMTNLDKNGDKMTNSEKIGGKMTNLDINNDNKANMDKNDEHKETLDSKEDLEDEMKGDVNFETLMKAIQSVGDSGDSLELKKIDFKANDIAKCLENKDKEMTELLSKYKTIYQKKRQMDIIQKSLAKQFAISNSAAKVISESVFEDSADEMRSVFVTNLHYEVSLEALKELFQPCGEILRTTIPTTRNSMPKGYAFVEFKEEDAIEKALKLTGTNLKGREITVKEKRQNIPGMGAVSGRRGGRRRGRRGRRGRGGFKRGRYRRRGRGRRGSRF